MPAKTLRADARRNREKILAAAAEVFAERGLDASLEEIARRAQVSIGTLYNRFPSREDLVDAVFSERLTAYVEAGEQALADDDPWRSFAGFLARICELQATDRGLNDLLTRQLQNTPAIDELARCGHEQAFEVIRRAQRSGVLRADFRPEDLPFIVWANAQIIEATRDSSPNAWRRHLNFLLDGLRAEAAHENPEPPLRPEDVLKARLSLGGGSRDRR
ncbi:TetR/AcrR family transcriptional regulator [Flindersiella endophytica]